MEIIVNDSIIYQNIFQKLTYPVLIIDFIEEDPQHYKFYEVNEAACALFNLSREELLTKEVSFLINHLSPAVVEAVLGILKSKGEISSIVDLPDADGQLITCEINASVIEENNRPMIFCMLKKYTEPTSFIEKLTDENHYLQTVINTIQSIVLILDKEGHIHNWNKFSETLTGYTLEEIQYKKFWDVFIGDDEKPRVIQKYKAGNIPVDYENVWTMKNGEKRYLKWKSDVIKDTDGEQLYIISTGSDITEQVLSMQEFERSKEKYKTLVSSMDDLVFTIDSSLKIKSVYGRWLEANHVSKGFFEGKSVKEIFPETTVHTEQCQKALTGYSADFEWEYTFNGKNHYFHIILSPILLKNDEVKEIVGVTRDITEQKNLEAQSKRIYEAVASGIIVQDHNGRIINANENACRILGYSKDELIQMSSMNTEWNALDVTGEALPGEEHPAMITLKTGETYSNVEMAIFNPEKNEKRWILVDTRPVYEMDDPQKIEYVLATFQDITEKKEMDELLHQSEKLAVIGQLASGIAHEIRNPLTGIMGFIKLLDETPDKEKLYEYLPVIKTELDHIHRITEEFIELSIAQDYEWEKADLPEIIHSALSAVQMDLDQKRINIEVRVVPTEKITVWGVKKQLKQVFVNLFKNSIEAMDEDGILDILVERQGKEVFVNVIDNGRGISPERLKHLGEPYYSIKEKGTGIGLMRCLKVVQEHNGKIHFESEAGKGTAVTIELALVD